MNSNGNNLQGLGLNNPWRALTVRYKKAALWPIALVLLGVLAVACSGNPDVTPTPVTTTPVTPTPVTPTPVTPTPVTPTPVTPTPVTPTPVTPTPVTTSTPEEGPALTTHLYALESYSVRLEDFDGHGGAIASMGDDLLVVMPKGRFAMVFRDGAVEYLDGNVPMNETSLEEHEDYGDQRFTPNDFRVADILLKELGEGRYELYATHYYFTGECIRFRLSSTAILRDEERVTVLPDWRTIFDAEPCLPLIDFAGHQAGGKMLTDGADHLLAIIGDLGVSGWWNRPPFDPALDMSKLFRIAIETGEAEVLARGFRNPQGLARDADGNLWAPEHGPQGGDELNLLERGGNYGWPLVSYGVEYGGVAPQNMEDEEVGRHDGFRRPVFAWVPSPALSAIAVNDERHFPLWKDDLLIASLKDQSLFRVRRHGTDVQYVEKIEVGYRIRDLTFMPDGRIALLRDGPRVHFLSRSPRYCDEESRNRRDIYSLDCESGDGDAATDSPGAGDPGTAAPSGKGDPGTDTAAGDQLFGLHCNVCHNLNVELHGPGPHLVGVIGRRAGEVEGYRFSAAFDSLDVVWTRDSITRFLTDPEQFAPGTSMPPSGIGEAEARAIADYLSSLNHLSRLVRDSQPAISSDFDVYLSENTLVYVKEPCAPADTEAMFFLALYPVDVNAIPDHRQQHGFDNLDFEFYWFGGVFDGRCTATVALPDYDIARISTGQYVPVEGGFNHIWEGEFRLGE